MFTTAVPKCIWCVALLCFAKIHFCIKYIFASNTFLHQIHFCIKYICNILFCKNAVFFALQKTKMLPLHFVGAKMLCFLLCKKQRCCPYILLVLNIFLWKMWCWTFYFVKCDALQKCIFASNAFLHSWTFSFGKCTLNIFLWKMYAKMHL